MKWNGGVRAPFLARGTGGMIGGNSRKEWAGRRTHRNEEGQPHHKGAVNRRKGKDLGFHSGNADLEWGEGGAAKALSLAGEGGGLSCCLTKGRNT